MPATFSTGGPAQVDPDKIIVKQVASWKETLDLLPSRLELCRTVRDPTREARRLAKRFSELPESELESLVTHATTPSSHNQLMSKKP